MKPPVNFNAMSMPPNTILASIDNAYIKNSNAPEHPWRASTGSMLSNGKIDVMISHGDLDLLRFGLTIVGIGEDI